MNTILKITFLILMFSHAAFAHENEQGQCQIFKAAESSNSANFSDPKKTNEQFELIIYRVTSLYAETIKDMGANLTKELVWVAGESNAFAMKVKTEWMLFFFGDLYRNEHMTDDSMALTVCHELGHLIGGAPYVAGTKMSVEGQADFWSTSVCLKKYFNEFPETVEMKEGVAKQRCDAQYPVDPSDRNICYRTANASMAMATFLSSMAKTKQPKFEQKNQTTMKTTKQLHPEAQCRLDTYMAGALCELGDTGLSFEKKLLTDNLTTDFLCIQNKDGEALKSEQRPACWFNEYSNTIFHFYKDKIKSKNLIGLKGGTISLTYFNNLPGDYTVKLIPDAMSAHYVKLQAQEFKFKLEASSSHSMLFTYKFMKKADRKLKFRLIVETKDKVILDSKNAFIVNAYSLVPN